MKSSNRRALREATSQSHAQLDAAVGNASPFAGLDHYRRYLSAMHGLFRFCEASLEWIEQNTDLPSRDCPVADLIASDLASAGAEPPKAADRQSLRLGDANITISQRWGQAYVMEGSAMGARYMVRGAESELPENVEMKFLRQLEIDAGTRWPRFVAALDAQALDQQEASAAAREVFEKAFELFASDHAGSDRNGGSD